VVRRRESETLSVAQEGLDQLGVRLALSFAVGDVGRSAEAARSPPPDRIGSTGRESHWLKPRGRLGPRAKSAAPNLVVLPLDNRRELHVEAASGEMELVPCG
jgi:hypothetical protein